MADVDEASQSQDTSALRTSIESGGFISWIDKLTDLPRRSILVSCSVFAISSLPPLSLSLFTMDSNAESIMLADSAHANARAFRAFATSFAELERRTEETADSSQTFISALDIGRKLSSLSCI